MKRRVVLAGVGGYLPQNILTNDDLAKIVETSDEWIQKRTGIQSRRIASEQESTSDLAVNAARQAMRRAAVQAEDIDMILVATTTPDQTFPATAALVQARLGVPAGRIAFDVQAVCSGFLYGLSIARAMVLADSSVNTVLLIGAETMSRIMDWQDRTTCVLFGDGAGAAILKAEQVNESGAERGLIDVKIYSDGSNAELLYTSGGPGTTGQSGKIVMAGRDVFKHAVANLASCASEILDANGLSSQDVDWLVPHQANQRIIDATAQKLGLPEEKVIMTIAEHGNTSAASVPLALNAGFEAGKFKSGDLLLLEAMGAGLTWGAALLRL